MIGPAWDPEEVLSTEEATMGSSSATMGVSSILEASVGPPRRSRDVFRMPVARATSVSSLLG